MMRLTLPTRGTITTSLLCLVLAACNSGSNDITPAPPQDPPAPPGPSALRVLNASGYDFDLLEVAGPDQFEDYGPLLAGEATEYRLWPTAYSYAAIRVEVLGQEFMIQPIDYVGESPIGGGLHAYELTFAEPTVPNGLRIRWIDENE